MNVGILVIATGKYDCFVQPLWQSVKKFFLSGTDHSVTMLVHSDRTKPREADGRYALEWFEQDHLGWPGSTLYRYHVFLRTAQFWHPRFDAIYYMDADMLLASPVGEEIFGELVAVTHPGYWRDGHAPFPHEARPKSLAFVPASERKAYFCGGVQGGKAGSYLDAMEKMKMAINIDFNNGVIATWHDESHWNHFLALHSPTKILGPEYCVPQEFEKEWPVQPRILALKKDHAKFQGAKP